MTGGGSGRSAGAAATLGDSAFGASAFGASRLRLGCSALGVSGMRATSGARAEPSPLSAQALDRRTRQIVGIAALFLRRAAPRQSRPGLPD